MLIETSLNKQRSHLFNNRIFRGCSNGGELARLGGLAHIVEISPSSGNYYKI